MKVYSHAPSYPTHMAEPPAERPQAYVETQPVVVNVDIGRGKLVNIPPALINELNGLDKTDPARSPLRATIKILMNYDGKYPSSCVDRMDDPSPPPNGNECVQFKFVDHGPKDAHHFYCEFKGDEMVSLSVRKENGESIGDLPARPASVAGKLPPGGSVRSGASLQQALIAQLPSSSKRTADNADASEQPQRKRAARDPKPLPPILTDAQVREEANADYMATIEDWNRFEQKPMRGKVLPNAAKLDRSGLKDIFTNNAVQYENYKKAVIEGVEHGVFNNVSRNFVLNRLATVAGFVSHLSGEAGIDAKAKAGDLGNLTQRYRERTYARLPAEWSAVNDFLHWAEQGKITELTKARRM